MGFNLGFKGLSQDLYYAAIQKLSLK